jgi:hypothetical protein
MKRLLLALLAAAVAATALLVTSGTATSGQQVSTAGKKFVTHNCVQSRIRPREIDLTCQNGSGNLDRLKWKRWGGARAKGRGKYIHIRPRGVRKPPKVSNPFPVRVKLTRSRPCSSKGGKQHYRKVIFRFTDGKPKGVNRTERQRINCPVNF